LIGARQGQADKVHAIDVLRLKPAIIGTIATWDFNETIPNPSAVPEFGPFRTGYSELKRRASAIAKTQHQLFRWHSETVDWLGKETDKEALVRELKETIETAKAAGVAVGLDVRGLLQLVEEFRGTKVMTALEDTAKLEAGASRGLVLTILGRGHQPVARVCDRLRHQLEPFLQSVEAELVSEAAKYGADPLEEAVTSLTGDLDELASLLDGVEKL
jgi:hypothetical protein